MQNIGRDRLSIAYGLPMESLAKGRFGKFECDRHSSPSLGGKWFFVTLWPAGLAEYDEMEAISWKWPSIDGGIVKAALAPEAVGPNPIDRKKRSLVTNREDRWSKSVITGSTGSGKSRSAMKNST